MDNRELQREKSLSYLDGCLTGLKFANSCEDAVSRDAIRLKIADMPKYTDGKSIASMRHLKDYLEKEQYEVEVTQDVCKGFTLALEPVREFVIDLPPVLPMYKQGKWIDFGLADKYGTHEYKCTSCNNSVYDKEDNIKYHKYCLHCGSRNEVADD